MIWVGRELRDHLLPTLLQGHLPLSIQAGLGHLQDGEVTAWEPFPSWEGLCALQILPWEGSLLRFSPSFLLFKEKTSLLEVEGGTEALLSHILLEGLEPPKDRSYISISSF